MRARAAGDAAEARGAGEGATVRAEGGVREVEESGRRGEEWRVDVGGVQRAADGVRVEVPRAGRVQRRGAEGGALCDGDGVQAELLAGRAGGDAVQQGVWSEYGWDADRWDGGLRETCEM